MGHSEDKPPTGGGPEEEKGKVFFKSDESWKAEAQKEKDRLQQKAEAEKAVHELPPPTFLSFLSNLGMEAMLALGVMPVKGVEAPKQDLNAARYIIDVLGIIEEKTRGNLRADEKGQLTDLLQNLRFAFAAAARKKEEEEKKVVEPGKGKGKTIIT